MINDDNTLDFSYANQVRYITLTGDYQRTRNGTTLSKFGTGRIHHNMQDGFPILTTKKVSFSNVLSELLWFMRGDTELSYLLHRGCNIWNDDAWNYYQRQVIGTLPVLSKEEFIQQCSDYPDFKYNNLGKIYGYQWRSEEYGDQLQTVIDMLIKGEHSRRMIVNAWSAKDLEEMALPPCHYSFQFYVRRIDSMERAIHKKDHALSLMWNQRSVDMALGLPYNISSYGLLLSIVANIVGMMPDKLICNMGDAHIYADHVDALNDQVKRTPYPLPRLVFADSVDFSSLDNCIKSIESNEHAVTLENYKHHPAVQYKLHT